MIISLFPLSPFSRSCHCAGIGIQKNLAAVKQMAVFRIVGAVYPVCIFKILDVQSEHDHGIDVTDLIGLRKRQNRIGFLRPPAKQKQFTRRSVMRMNRKIDTAWQCHCAIDIKHARAHRISGNLTHWCDCSGIIQHIFLTVQLQAKYPRFLFFCKQPLSILFLRIRLSSACPLANRISSFQKDGLVKISSLKFHQSMVYCFQVCDAAAWQKKNNRRFHL